MTHPHFRAKLFHILHKPSPLNAWARYVNYFLAFLILANAIFVSLETVPAIAVVYKTEFIGLKLFQQLYLSSNMPHESGYA